MKTYTNKYKVTTDLQNAEVTIEIDNPERTTLTMSSTAAENLRECLETSLNAIKAVKS